MPSGYYCPRCQSENIIVYDDYIECTDCRLNFSIENIESDIEDNNILAEEELHGISKAFSEEEHKKLKKIFEEEDFS